MPDPANRSGHSVALVLSGGVSLGAYEAGAYAALAGAGGRLPERIAGCSIGAITGAIIAGNPPERRVARLQQFWDGVTADPTPVTSFWLGAPPAGAWRQFHNAASVAETLLFGRPGLFRPRLVPGARAGAPDVSALYDLAPLRDRLPALVDFDLLNEGPVRLILAATDVGTGERVVFDTRGGTRIGPEHVLASCALLPVFAPVEIGGRLLADGGLASNAPLDLVLAEPAAGELVCFVIDLFAPEGRRPHTLPAGLSRATDLAFGNQTRRLLESQAREHRLRALIGQLAARLPPELRADPAVAPILAEGRPGPARVLSLNYRAALDEAGFAKPFDFSRATLADRWAAGERAMRDALAALGQEPGAECTGPAP